MGKAIGTKWGSGLPGSYGSDQPMAGYQPDQPLPSWATPNNISEDAIRHNDGLDSLDSVMGGMLGMFDWTSLMRGGTVPGGVKYNPRESLPDWASPDYVPQRANVPQQTPSAQAAPAQRLSGGTEHIKAMVDAMANTPHSQQTEVSRALRAAPTASEGE